MSLLRKVTLARALWPFGAIAVALATIVVGPVGDDDVAGARLTATATDGSFTQSNSRDDPARREGRRPRREQDDRAADVARSRAALTAAQPGETASGGRGRATNAARSRAR